MSELNLFLHERRLLKLTLICMKRILSIFDFGNVFNLSLSYILVNFLEHIENNNDT
jgi:hypothetical protein